MTFVTRADEGDNKVITLLQVGKQLSIRECIMHINRYIQTFACMNKHNWYMSRNQFQLEAGARTSLSERSAKQMNTHTNTHTQSVLTSVHVCACTSNCIP